MHNRKTMVLGSSWAIGRFVLVFAKSVVLVPLILSFWGTQLYTFWILLLAANALWGAVYDGYIRYVTNAYNLYFYTDKEKAGQVLGSGIKFAVIASVVLLMLLAGGIAIFPQLTAAIFKASLPDVLYYKLGLVFVVFIAGNTCLNLLRFFYALNDPLGKLWRNLRFEVGYSIAEIILLVFALTCIRTFWLVVSLNALLYLIATVLFLVSIYRRYPQLPGIIRSGKTTAGAKLFRSSVPFISNNFIERLATDAYTLLLSVFAWPVLIIQQFASIRTMTNAGISGMNIFQSVTVPKIQEHEAKKNHAALLHTFRWLWLLAAVLTGTLLVPLYPFLQRVYLTWTKGKIALDPVVFGLLFICLLVVLFGNVLLYYLKSVNETKTVLVVTVVKIVLLFALLFLLPHTAVYAVADLLVAEVVANIFLYPLFIARKWKKETQTGWLAPFAKALLPFLLIAGAIGYYMLYGFNIAFATIVYGVLLVCLFILYKKSKKLI